MLKATALFSFFLISFCVQAQTVSFTFANSSGSSICSPATINFTQTCTGSPIGFTWSFGNGQISNAANPTTTFTVGTYTIKLTAVFDGQVLETSQTITVNPSIAVSLTADRNYICTAGPINFTATATGTINTYEWNFGDGATLITTVPNTVHNYTTIGSYIASVRAIDVSGCTANNSTNIILQNPPITGSVTPTAGCAPVMANFNANVNVPTGSTVSNYFWAFGDGSSVASTTANSITHNYADSGTYLTSVNIVTSEGCTNTLNLNTLTYGIPPINHVAYPKKLVYCGSETAMLVAKATYANAYTWAYGDGVIETIADTLALHDYLTLGVKNITVTPLFNGCAGTPISFSINIVGVIASFNYANTCTAKKTFSFTNTSQGVISSSQWTFNDATPDDIMFNTTHTFPPNGAYPVRLIVRDNATSCADTITNAIYTANPTLINPDTFVCRNSNTAFNFLNNYINGNKIFNWYVLGFPLVSNANEPYNVNASTFGNFTNNYVVINVGAQYCADTLNLNHAINVRGPNLSFTSPTEVCANTPIFIRNTSAAYLPSDTVNLWYWNYGILSTNDTTYIPDTLNYSAPNNYTIKLVAKDKNGCIDSLQKNVLVKAIPFLRVFPIADTLCQGQSDSLFAYHSDTLLWRPAALLSCNTCDTTIATPINTTVFYATATNSLGCSVSDSSIITVFEPFTATVFPNPILGCVGDTVRLSASPLGKKIIWTPATSLSNNTIYNPTAIISNRVIYTALLADSLNCFSSSATINIIAKQLPTVNAGPNQIVPYNTNFTITPNYSNNVTMYNWLPINNLNCNGCPFPNGLALTTQTYVIKATSDSGCIAKDTITIFVECKNANLFIPTAFSPNNDNKNDIFYAQTRGIQRIKAFTVYNRFGQIVFNVKNVPPNDKLYGWDGRFKGIPQVPDAYVYTLEAVCDLGQIIVKKDSFILIK